MDLVEGEGVVVTPVEYKRGRPRETDAGHEAWDADRVQVCVQALVSRDNGFTVDEAVIYYDTTKQRVRVPIDESLLQKTLDTVAAARAVASTGRIPPPLIDSPKCPRCSLSLRRRCRVGAGRSARWRISRTEVGSTA